MLKGWTNSQQKFQVFVRNEYFKFSVFISVAQDTILVHHSDATLKISVMNLYNWIFFDIFHSVTYCIQCNLSPSPLRKSTGSLLMVANRCFTNSPTYIGPGAVVLKSWWCLATVHVTMYGSQSTWTKDCLFPKSPTIFSPMMAIASADWRPSSSWNSTNGKWSKVKKDLMNSAPQLTHKSPCGQHYKGRLQDHK